MRIGAIVLVVHGWLDLAESRNHAGQKPFGLVFDRGGVGAQLETNHDAVQGGINVQVVDVRRDVDRLLFDVRCEFCVDLA